MSSRELAEAINTDFGSYNNHKKIDADIFQKGSYGIEGLVQKVVRPFLDAVPLESTQYFDKVKILGQFCARLAAAIDDRFPKVKMPIFPSCLITYLSACIEDSTVLEQHRSTSATEASANSSTKSVNQDGIKRCWQYTC